MNSRADSSSAAIVAVVVLLLIALAVLYFGFGGALPFTTRASTVNINNPVVQTPGGVVQNTTVIRNQNTVVQNNTVRETNTPVPANNPTNVNVNVGTEGGSSGAANSTIP